MQELVNSFNDGLRDVMKVFGRETETKGNYDMNTILSNWKDAGQGWVDATSTTSITAEKKTAIGNIMDVYAKQKFPLLDSVQRFLITNCQNNDTTMQPFIRALNLDIALYKALIALKKKGKIKFDGKTITELKSLYQAYKSKLEATNDLKYISYAQDTAPSCRTVLMYMPNLFVNPKEKDFQALWSLYDKQKYPLAIEVAKAIKQRLKKSKRKNRT